MGAVVHAVTMVPTCCRDGDRRRMGQIHLGRQLQRPLGAWTSWGQMDVQWTLDVHHALSHQSTSSSLLCVGRS